MIALVGDAELDEGNIFEALLEGWKQGLRNCWWVIDYNRQSLDAVVREGLWERYEQLFKNFGWDVVILKYGSLQQAAFREPGGETLQAMDRHLPQPALLGAGVPGRRGVAQAAARRDRRPGRRSPQLIEKRSDDELARLMNNLGGHDLPSLLEAFGKIDHDRPTCFICYTVKGFGLPMAGHKDNHAGLMTPAQMESVRAAMNIRPGHEWDRFEGLATPARTSCRRSSTACRSRRAASAASRRRRSRCRTCCRSRSSRPCRRSSASARCSTSWRARSPRWRSASSPPRPTSRSRPISARG